MAKDKPLQVPDMSQALQMLTQMPVPTNLLAPRAEVAWRAQENLIRECERYAHAWFQRRRDAAESAQRCLERVQKSGNADGAQVNAAVEELNTWMSDEMKRLSSDTQENMEFCMRCFGLLSDGANSAGAERAENTPETVSEADGEAQKSSA